MLSWDDKADSERVNKKVINKKVTPTPALWKTAVDNLPLSDICSAVHKPKCLSLPFSLFSSLVFGNELNENKQKEIP